MEQGPRGGGFSCLRVGHFVMRTKPRHSPSSDRADEQGGNPLGPLERCAFRHAHKLPELKRRHGCFGTFWHISRADRLEKIWARNASYSGLNQMSLNGCSPTEPVWCASLSKQQGTTLPSHVITQPCHIRQHSSASGLRKNHSPFCARSGAARGIRSAGVSVFRLIDLRGLDDQLIYTDALRVLLDGVDFVLVGPTTKNCHTR